MPVNSKNRYKTSEYYIDGSTVRKLEAAPEVYPYEREHLTQEERRRRAEIKKRRAIAQRNKERALRLDLTYTLFLIVSVVVISFNIGNK